MKKPTKEDLRDARRRTTEDLIDYDLKVLFCGINPGIWSGATGFHFAKPGNRFWKTLHLAGFTNQVFYCRPKNTNFSKTATASHHFANARPPAPMNYQTQKSSAAETF